MTSGYHRNFFGQCGDGEVTGRKLQCEHCSVSKWWITWVSWLCDKWKICLFDISLFIKIQCLSAKALAKGERRMYFFSRWLKVFFNRIMKVLSTYSSCFGSSPLLCSQLLHNRKHQKPFPPLTYGSHYRNIISENIRPALRLCNNSQINNAAYT